MNLQKVALLKKRGVLTRADLADVFGISRPGVDQKLYRLNSRTLVKTNLRDSEAARLREILLRKLQLIHDTISEISRPQE